MKCIFARAGKLQLIQLLVFKSDLKFTFRMSCFLADVSVTGYFFFQLQYMSLKIKMQFLSFGMKGVGES